jgi:hypothetical protein
LVCGIAKAILLLSSWPAPVLPRNFRYSPESTKT